jgi:hypothetical protein
MKDLVKNFNIIIFDSISKFNIYDKKKILKIDNLKIYVKLKSVDALFLKNFLFLSKIYFYLFKRKITILKVIQDFSKLNKLKNSLIFYVGITYKDQKSIFNILNYLLNVVTSSSKKSDDFFKFKRKEKNFLYFFKNINYFLGLDFSKFSKWDLDFNFLFIFKNYNNDFILNKKIVNFYEKLFF